MDPDQGTLKSDQAGALGSFTAFEGALKLLLGCSACIDDNPDIHV